MNDHSSLICINTCNRLSMLRRVLPAYVKFCHSNPQFHLVLALDGKNAEYERFCSTFHIPLIWSDLREGVGLSKNRVLTSFPNYTYYFFIEDDVELIESEIFERHINMFKRTGIPHFVITHPRKIIKRVPILNDNIIQAYHGSSHFCFYDGQALKKVGGWHTQFSKYRRFGHTEHTYRFFFSQLTPAPFNVIESCMRSVIIHNPPHITNSDESCNEDELIKDEQEMIDSKQKYFPLQTISQHHFNKLPFEYGVSVAKIFKDTRSRYPLLKGREKPVAFSDYFYHIYFFEKNPIKRFYFLLASFILNPVNNTIKHNVKQFLGLIK